MLAWLTARSVVRGTIDGPLPADILDRIATVVESPSRVVVVDDAPRALGYRVISPRATTLQIRAVGSAQALKGAGMLEDVRLDVDGDRLRFELRFPKRRAFAFAYWAMLWSVVHVVMIVGLLAAGERVTWAFWSALATLPLLWVLTAVTVADERRDMPRLLTQIVSQARRPRSSQ